MNIAMPSPAKTILDPNTLEAMAEEAIAACDGDARAAVKALLVANAWLETELDEAVELVSKGYVRGRVRSDAGS